MTFEPAPDGGRQRYFGLYPAIVTDVVDPNGLGRIQVKLPWLGETGDRDVRAWATLLSPYADEDQGLMTLPAVDSQVVVAFEAGDPRRPYIVGAAWNGVETLPEEPAEANDVRVLKTRSGSVLRFVDTGGAEVITLATESGHELKLDNASDEVVLTHKNGARITIDAAGKVDVQANSSVEVNAPVMNVHAATANFDGVVNCVTLIASSAVVSPSYTPGAGNVW